jgi:hypothetical protein
MAHGTHDPQPSQEPAAGAQHRAPQTPHIDLAKLELKLCNADAVAYNIFIRELHPFGTSEPLVLVRTHKALRPTNIKQGTHAPPDPNHKLRQQHLAKLTKQTGTVREAGYHPIQHASEQTNSTPSRGTTPCCWASGTTPIARTCTSAGPALLHLRAPGPT